MEVDIRTTNLSKEREDKGDGMLKETITEQSIVTTQLMKKTADIISFQV